MRLSIQPFNYSSSGAAYSITGQIDIVITVSGTITYSGGSLTTYSISKDPTGTKLSVSKNSSNRVLVTKNPGNTKAYISKNPGGTVVSIVKNDSS